MLGIKHLIECQCSLPQYRNAKKPVYHKFVVFSVINDSDMVIEKIAQCNNCGIIHRVFDIKKSEILIGKEDGKNSILSKEDMRLMLPSAVTQVLDTYSCDQATWEQCLFLVEHKNWDIPLVVSREEDTNTNTIKGKIMHIMPAGGVKIETFSDSNFIGI